MVWLFLSSSRMPRHHPGCPGGWFVIQSLRILLTGAYRPLPVPTGNTPKVRWTWSWLIYRLRGQEAWLGPLGPTRQYKLDYSLVGDNLNGRRLAPDHKRPLKPSCDGQSSIPTAVEPKLFMLLVLLKVSGPKQIDLIRPTGLPRNKISPHKLRLTLSGCHPLSCVL